MIDYQHAYIVRLKDSHELVGFFVAESLGELLSYVDEFVSPGDCEATIVHGGGICWPREIAMRVPVQFDDDGELKEGAHSPGGWDLTESWRAVTFEAGRRWRSLCL